MPAIAAVWHSQGGNLIALPAAASDRDSHKRRVKLAEEHVTPFAPGGFIEIRDSFGAVHATA